MDTNETEIDLILAIWLGGWREFNLDINYLVLTVDVTLRSLNEY